MKWHIIGHSRPDAAAAAAQTWSCLTVLSTTFLLPFYLKLGKFETTSIQTESDLYYMFCAHLILT